PIRPSVRDRLAGGRRSAEGETTRIRYGPAWLRGARLTCRLAQPPPNRSAQSRCNVDIAEPDNRLPGESRARIDCRKNGRIFRRRNIVRLANVLIVDDDQGTRDLFSIGLRLAGF